MNKKYFVTADPHSYYTELITGLNKKGFELTNPEHYLVICGDLFDRGPDSKEILEFVQSIPPERFIYIRGNHEDLLEDCVEEVGRGYTISTHHQHNGTVRTIRDLTSHYLALYGRDDLEERLDIYNQMLPILDWINKKAVDYYEIGDFIFVHGWIPCDSDDPIPYHAHKHFKFKEDWKDNTSVEGKAAWKDARWTSPVECYKQGIILPGRTIICGHWHTSAGHHFIKNECSEWGRDAIFTPFIDKGIVMLDACTVHSGFVNVITLTEDDHGNYTMEI